MVDQSVQLQIRARRALGVKKTKRKPRRPRFPLSIEREYRRLLVNYIKQMRAVVNAILMPRLPAILTKARAFRPDSLIEYGIIPMNRDGWVEDLGDILRSVTFSLSQRVPSLERSIDDIARKVADWNKAEVNQVVRSVMGVDVFASEPWLRDQVASFIKQQRDYVIEDLTPRATAQISAITQRAGAQGRSAKDVGQDIAHMFDITQRRAELIARNEIATFNGVLTQARQQQIGVEQYIWRTSLDERVRPEHEEREGETFSWSDPPDDGHPGIPINCRCVAEPVLSSLLEPIE